MASQRLQRVLRQGDLASQSRGVGKSGTLYYPCVIFTGAHDLYPAHQSSDGTAKVVYESKDGRTQKTFDALDWVALLTTHIPNKNEQMVRYYGYYSNKSRGLRTKAGKDSEVAALIENH